MSRPADETTSCVVCGNRGTLVDARDLAWSAARWIKRRPVLCRACQWRLRRRDLGEERER